MLRAHLWILGTFSMQFAIRHGTLNHRTRVLVCGTLESKACVFNRCWREWFSHCVFELAASCPLNTEPVNRVCSST